MTSETRGLRKFADRDLNSTRFHSLFVGRILIDDMEYCIAIGFVRPALKRSISPSIISRSFS